MTEEEIWKKAEEVWDEKDYIVLLPENSKDAYKLGFEDGYNEALKQFYNDLNSILSYNSDYFDDVEFVKVDDFKYLMNQLRSKINNLDQYTEQVNNKILSLTDKELTEFVWSLQYEGLYFDDISDDLKYYYNRYYSEYEDKFEKLLPKYREKVNQYLISIYEPENYYRYDRNIKILEYLLNIEIDNN